MNAERPIFCPSCRYDLRASVRDDGTARCAECGHHLDAIEVYYQQEMGLVGSWRSMGRLTIPGGFLAIFATMAVTMKPDAAFGVLLAALASITLILAGIGGFAWYHRQDREQSHLPRAMESFTFALIMMIWNIGVGVAGLGLFASIMSVFGSPHFL